MSDEINVIFAYTRAQALADGVLIDCSGMAREAGFRVPVALTHTVNALYVQVPPGVTGQDEAGRLWDILWMSSRAARREAGQLREVLFEVLVRNDNVRPKKVTLKAVCGPDDDGEPCVTIMLPSED